MKLTAEWLAHATVRELLAERLTQAQPGGPRSFDTWRDNVRRIDAELAFRKELAILSSLQGCRSYRRAPHIGAARKLWRALASLLTGKGR